MNICAVCKTIPFSTLPAEEQPALPHHKSLKDLESSAKTCCLCLLLLRAAGELSMILKNDRDDNGEDSQGWLAHGNQRLPSGKKFRPSLTWGLIRPVELRRLAGDTNALH